MEKPKGDKMFGERMKILREERKKMKVKKDLEDTQKNSENKLKNENDTLNDTGEQIKVLQNAILDLSLDVEYLMAQM